MMIAKRAVALGLTIAALTAQPVSAATFSSLLVFGDSLVDTGNAQTGSLAAGLPDPAPASAGYSNGRFSNGPNFADFLSVGIGAGLSSPYLQGGSNFGVGGAQAYTAGGAIPGFAQQLAIFGSLNQPISSSALVLVTFGGNDVRATLSNPGTADFTASIAALSTGLDALIAAGARNIVVTGVPDIGDLPGSRKVAGALGNPGILTLATARSAALSSAFATTTATVAQATGANVQFFDLLGLEASLIADPTAFGLPSTLIRDTSCVAAGAVAEGCSGYLYFDDLHPTTQIHAVIANRIALQAAVPEPATWTMLLLGFALVGGALRRTPRLRIARAAA
jgi:outer membrane lipase/esterase